MEPTFASTSSYDSGSGHVYIVQKGDSLSLIAKRIYGSLRKWRELADFNGIKNPNRIYPGDSVRYPDNAETAGFSSQYQNLARETIQVKQGDTLASIASAVYRDSGAWKSLWRQNGSIDNPNRILVGQKLTFIPLDTLYQFMGNDGARSNAAAAPRRAPRATAKKAEKAAPVAEVKAPVRQAAPAAAPAAAPVEPVAASAPSAPEPPAIPEVKEEPRTAAAPKEENTKQVLEETSDEADEMMKPNDNLEEVIDSDETE
jgi:LysM repeat protein